MRCNSMGNGYGGNVFVFEDGSYTVCHDTGPHGPCFHKHRSTVSLWDCAIDNQPRTAIGGFALYRRGASLFLLVGGKPFRVRDTDHAVGAWLLLRNNDAAVFPASNDRHPPRQNAARRAA